MGGVERRILYFRGKRYIGRGDIKNVVIRVLSREFIISVYA